MIELSLCSGPIQILIKGNEEFISLLRSNIQTIYRVIPITNSANATTKTVNISVQFDRFFQVHQSGSNYRVHDIEKNFNVTSFLYNVLTPIVSTELLRAGYLFVHGSVIKYRNQGIVMIGNGKTSTALNMANLEGAAFMAEDNFILNYQSIIGQSGTNKFINQVDVDHNGKVKKWSHRVDCEKIQCITNTKIDVVFALSAAYSDTNFAILKGVEHNSICSKLVNERLLNQTRWYENGQHKSPILLNDDDMELVSIATQNLISAIRTYSLNGNIDQYPTLINRILP